MESDEQQDFERKSETRGFRKPRRPKVVLLVSDVRNKLSPIKNLIAMIENRNLDDPRIAEMVQSEIAEAKKSIEYLSGNSANTSTPMAIEPMTCGSCGSTDIDSTHSDSAHECFACGNNWTTEHSK